MSKIVLINGSCADQTADVIVNAATFKSCRRISKAVPQSI